MVEPGTAMALESIAVQQLQDIFGDRVETGVLLARYTAARLGGPADALLEVTSAAELEKAVRLCWEKDLDFVILGGGSNVLVSDAGVRGLVILNKARRVRFDEDGEVPAVWAESGANFGLLARQTAERGLAGLEWAAGIPGTLGGAVVGNAGAHGSDMAHCLRLAEILHRVDKRSKGMTTVGTSPVAAPPLRETWTVETLEYRYRGSLLKTSPFTAASGVVLAAEIKLERSTPQAVQAKIEEFVAYRKRTQPPGASMGSIFKNPPGDYAGRLIEAVGLKGAQVGDAQISPVHANFFINLGQASAADIYALIDLARRKVAEQTGVRLDLEIELLGEW
jgi:UDP-N-acetylmuramate dehydrogenase